MILYIENPQTPQKNLLNLISEFGKAAGYKVNIQKSKAFQYTNNEISETEIRKKIPFALATRKNIVSWNKPNQGGKRPVLRKVYNTEERN